MFQNKKMGKRLKQINSSITISDSVNQQRSINESLGGSISQQSQFTMKSIKSNPHLQPLLLNDGKRVALQEKTFGLVQEPTNEYFRKLQSDGHLQKVLSLIQQGQDVSLSVRNKSTLAPMAVGSGKFTIGRYLADESYSSKVKVQSVQNNLSQNQSQIMVSPKYVSYAAPSQILQTDDSILNNFNEESLLIGSQLDIKMVKNKRFKEIQQRMQRELPSLYEKTKHFFQLLSMVDLEIKQRSEFDEQAHNLQRKFNTLCKQIQDVFYLFLGNLIDANSKVEKAEQGSFLFQEQIVKDKQILVEVSEMIKLKDEQLRAHQDGMSKRFQQTQLNKGNDERLRNAQLEKQLELCQAKLKGPNGSLAEQIKEENDQLRQQFEEMQFKIFSATQECEKQSTQIQVMKLGAAKQEKKFTSLKEKYELQEELMSNHEGMLKMEREKARRSEERAWMSREEILTIKFNTQEFVKSVQKNIEKIKQLQQRFDEMTVKRSKELDAPMQSHMVQDKETLYGINQLMDQDVLFQKTMQSQFQSNMEVYDSRLVNAYHTSLTQQQSKKGSDDNFKLSSFRLNYPGFPLLLNKRNLDQEWAHLANRNLQNIFIGQLRAIMDGMFVEFQKLQMGHKSVPSFQSFTYQWLSCFTIKENSQRVEVFPVDLPRHKIEEHILAFYLDLHVPRLDKVWEVQQFRYFLNDGYSQEELYFYLHARHILRRGPWLSSFNALSSIAHYMQSEQAFTIVRRFLKDFDEANVTIVIKSLSERTEQRGKRNLIMTGLVLQVLLEVFHIEMTNRYRSLQQSFPKMPVTFKSFHRFVQGNYIDITQSQIVELWREIYLISNGHPSLQAFFTIAQFLFIRELKLPSLWESHEVSNDNNIIFDEKNFVVLKLMEQLGTIEPEELEEFSNNIIQFGNQEHLQTLKLFQRPTGNSQPAVIIVQKLMELCLTWNLYNQHSQCINVEGYIEKNPDIKAHLNLIDFTFREVKQLRQEQLSIMRFRSQKLGKLQRLARVKMVKFYLVIASVLSGLHKDQEAVRAREKQIKALKQQ